MLAFLDTVCTRVGNSHGHNQGKQAAMSFPISPIVIYFHVKAAAVPSSEQIFLDIPFGAYVPVNPITERNLKALSMMTFKTS